MQRVIPLSTPNLSGNELAYVSEAVRTEWVSTGGESIGRFEKNMADYLKVPATVACQSGTAAIHMALRLCDVNYGDEVIVPTLTFIAAVNPAKYLGAEPIFMDCDDTLNMDLDKLECFLEQETVLRDGYCCNKRTMRKIKALVVVHIFGNPIPMEKVMEFAAQYHLKVVEDATEALGSYYETGKYAGKFAGTIGDFGAYSFNGNKIITTGGGGMLVSRHSDLLQKAKYLSNQAKDDELNYIHHEIGYNYRMTNLQAALGVAQLERLEEFIGVKTRNYFKYKEAIEKIPGLNLMPFHEKVRPNYWFYSLLMDEKEFGLHRASVIRQLQSAGIQSRPIWGLIHEQKPYLDARQYKIEKAMFYQKNILNLPCSTNLSGDDVLYVIDSLKNLKGY